MLNLLILVALLINFQPTDAFIGRWFSSFSKKVEGSGVLIEKEIKLPKLITDIELSGISNLIIMDGNDNSLIVKAENNILPSLQQVITGSHLALQNDNNIYPTKDITYVLKLKKSPKKIQANGNTSATIKMTKNEAVIIADGSSIVNCEAINLCQECKITANGSASVQIDFIEAKASYLLANASSNIVIKKMITQLLEVTTFGAGEVTVESGYTKDQSVFGNDASNYDGQNFTSTNSHVLLSGSSKAKIFFDYEVSGKLKNASLLKLYGPGKSIKLTAKDAAYYKHAS